MRKIFPKTGRAGVIVRGRIFCQEELVLIRRMIRNHPMWGRTRLSEAVCQLLDWRQINGRLKDRGCRVALLKLESLGFLELPKRKLDRGGRPPCIEFSQSRNASAVSDMPDSLTLQLVDSPLLAKTWNSLISTHHYLGLSTPVGRLIRYLVVGDEQILGAISFSEAAWSIKRRDELLEGFFDTSEHIRSRVVSNNRFLIIPNVRVNNLASRILGLSTKQITVDWQRRFGMVPEFIETFVDPARFKGTCYRASNWTLIGTTKGFSKQGASHNQQKSPKLLFICGTSHNSRKFLRLKIKQWSERRVA